MIRDRVREPDPTIDKAALSGTVEGLTDIYEIVQAIIRSALADEALARDLKGRIAEMEDRRDPPRSGLQKAPDRQGCHGRARPEEDHGARLHGLDPAWFADAHGDL